MITIKQILRYNDLFTVDNTKRETINLPEPFPVLEWIGTIRRENIIKNKIAQNKTK